MTIAGVYVTQEGVVLGADSTTSAPISPIPGSNGFHYFNYNQKLFEVGEGSTLGVITWGLASLVKSYRTLIAVLADKLANQSPKSVSEVADAWVTIFWAEYAHDLAIPMQRCKDLAAKAPNSAAGANPLARTDAEEAEYLSLSRDLVVGFCIAGYLPSDKAPAAFQIIFDPLANKPTPKLIPQGSYSFWGTPNPIKRLIFGADDILRSSLLKSGKWSGTEAELDAILEQQRFGHPLLPIREAVDFVHTCIYSTIKAMKFSNLFQVCGGPIELAVITSDRKFRWVRHKGWDAAILES